MRAIVLGATGLTGTLITELLASRPEVEKILVPGRSKPSFTHPKVEFSQVDLLSPELTFEHADAVFCCLGTTIKKAGSRDNFTKVDVDMPANAARAASAAGVPVFVMVSALGADTESKVFYNRAKGMAEQKIQLPGLQTLVFRPSILLGNRNEVRWGERIGIAFSLLLSPFLMGPLAKYKPTDARKLAIAMFHAYKNSAKLPRHKVYEGTVDIYSSVSTGH